MNFVKKYTSFISVKCLFLYLSLAAASIFYFTFTFKLYPLPQLYAAQDIGLLLDPGWRLLQGQMPHRDYISALGILWAIICAVPLFIWGPYYDSFTLFPAILFTFFSFLALTCTFQRLSKIMSFAFSITTGLVASGTYLIGFPPEWLGFAALYTRISYAILMIVILVALLPADSTNRNLEKSAGIISGTLACSLLFLKFNFCFIALGLCLWGCISENFRLRKNFIFFLAFSFIISLIVGFLLIGFNVAAFFRDMSYVATSRLSDVYLNSHLWSPEKIITSNITLIIFAAPFILTLFLQGQLVPAISTLLVLSATLTLGISQASGNGFGLPSMVSAFFLSCHYMTRHFNASKSTFSFFTKTIVLAISAWIIIIPQMVSFKTWFHISENIAQKIGSPIRKANAPLSTLLAGNQNSWGESFIKMVNEARSLAQKHVTNDKTLQFVDLSNFVNFGTFRSPKNSSLATDILVNVSNTNFQNPEILFSDTDFILLPKKPIAEYGTQNVWLKNYGEYISKTFKKLEETENFILFSK